MNRLKQSQSPNAVSPAINQFCIGWTADGDRIDGTASGKK